MGYCTFPFERQLSTRDGAGSSLHELVSRSVDHRVAAGFDEGMKAGVDFER